MTDITLLDGSIGQELANRRGAHSSPMWGAQVMMDAPEILVDVHREYFEAGATVASLNTYNLLRDRLVRNGIEDQFETLHRKAAEIGLKARDDFGSGQVALTMGPLGASYRPDLAPPSDQAAELYAEIVQVHGDSIDVILIETASSIDSARGALMGAAVSQKPIWLALSVEDDNSANLRSGEPVAEAVAALADLRFEKLLLNCSTPEAIDAAFPHIKDTRASFGAYANGFTGIAEEFKKQGQTVDALTAREDLSPAAYADIAMNWVAGGADIIGGCCEVGPAHIAEMAGQLKAAGHTIV